jgi:hypothetical protein
MRPFPNLESREQISNLVNFRTVKVKWQDSGKVGIFLKLRTSGLLGEYSTT